MSGAVWRTEVGDRAAAAAPAAAPAVSPLRVRERNFNVAMWIIPIAFLYAFLLSPLMMLRGAGGDEGINLASAEGSSSNKLFWIALLGATLYAWFKRKGQARYAVGIPVLLMGVYLVLAFVSATWSAVPGISLRRTVQQLIIVICLLMPFMMVADTQKLLLKICWIFAVVVLFNVVLIPALGLPAFGYRGIYGQKNSMGQISVVCFYFAMYAAFSYRNLSRWLFFAVAFGAFGLLVVSNSKTSLALLVLMPMLAGLVLCAARLHSAVARVAFTLALLFMVMSVYFASVLFSIGVSEISNFIFHDTTFTGRTKIWAFADFYINRSPWLGHGYGSFWGVGSGTLALGQGFIGALLQAHNGYIDILLETGYTGLFIATLLIIFTVAEVLRLSKINLKLALLALSSIFFVLLNNTMESSIFRSYVPLWVVFVFFCGIAGAAIADARRTAAAAAAPARNPTPLRGGDEPIR